MANCHDLFQTFDGKISIDVNKKKKIESSKESLRERIRKWFKENHSDYVPQFYIQGSMKMKSVIRTKDDICDLDDGVYFFREPDVEPTTLQEWVWTAVNGYTSTPSQHRKKCIRTTFVGDYEVDHPVYYKGESKDYQLAMKNIGWRADDPKAMVDWFAGKKDSKGRLIRTVKYLKAWCDNKRNNMPSGLAMTILSSNALSGIVLNERDDISLRDILSEIKKKIDMNFQCLVPVTPNDDLFSDYTQSRKDNFIDALNSFLDDANKAIKEENQLKSSKLWQKHLGTRFPEGEDKSDDSKLKSSIAAGAASSVPWMNG